MPYKRQLRIATAARGSPAHGCLVLRRGPPAWKLQAYQTPQRSFQAEHSEDTQKTLELPGLFS